MPLDKYTELKIASNVLDESITEMAESWGYTPQHVRYVLNGDRNSEKVSNLIDQKIKEAERVYENHKRQKAISQ